MKTLQKIHKLLILCALLSVFLTAEGQQCVTKSGSVVRPAPRIPASPKAQSTPAAGLPDESAGTYLVVTRPDLLPSLRPLLQWKRQQGFRVETQVMDTSYRDSIRNHILRRYRSSTPLRPAPSYVLLVGDVDRLQAFIGQQTPSGLNNHHTDLYYGEFTGDYVPEALVGRLSVSDSAELSIVVDKIIHYEQGRWAQRNRALLVAGKEETSPAPLTTNGQVNYLAELLADANTMADTVCYRNPQSDSLLPEIIADLDRENFLVNYSAHCTADGWHFPTLGIAAIDTLEHATPTIWVNNCCKSNAFNGNCFGEQLLRHPRGGAAGVLGATNESLWMEDYYWAVGAKYPVLSQPIHSDPVSGAFEPALGSNNTSERDRTLSGMNYNGCLAVTLAGSPYDAFYWEIYNLLGDPSMMPFFGTADSLQLFVADTIEAGITDILVQTNLPFSRVVATCDTTVLGIATTSAEGQATLSLGTLSAPSRLTITATAPNAIFAQKEVSVITPVQGRLALTQAEISGNQLKISIANIGQQTIHGHSLLLWQDSSDLRLGAILNTSHTAAIPALQPAQDTVLFFDIEGYTMGEIPLLQAHLTFTDSAANCRSQRIMLDLDAPVCQLLRVRILAPDGTPVKKIYGSQNYLISTQYSTQPDSMWLAINGESLSSSQADGQTYFAYHTADTLSHLLLDMTAFSHGHAWHFQRYLIPFQAMEDFESADLTAFPWQSPNIYPWSIDSSMAYDGCFSLRSFASLPHGLRSSISMRITTLEDDSISFFYNVSSEPHDWLYFYIDGRRRGFWSGNQDWHYWAYPLTAGEHELTWFYQKDVSNSELNDCAHIDNIRLPLALWHQPSGQIVPEDPPTVGVLTPQPSHLALQPNPCRESVLIHTDACPEDRILQVYDQQGRLVDEIKIQQNSTSTQYSTQHLRFGIFMLVLHHGQYTSRNKLIVIR